MQEKYKVGDFVGAYDNNKKVIFGTIIAISSDIVMIMSGIENIITHIKDIWHGGKQFPTGCIVKNKLTGELHIIRHVYSNGTYDTDISKLVPHYNLEYAAKINDIVEFKNNGETAIGKVIRVSESTGFIIIDDESKFIHPKYIVRVLYARDNIIIKSTTSDMNIATLKSNEVNSINLFNVENNENRLQKETNSVRGTDSSVGSRIYGRRPKVKVSIGSLSYKARIGYN